MTRHPVLNVFDEAAALVNSKAHDYAESEDVFSNFKFVAEMTETDVENVIFSHIANKVARFKQIRGKGEAKHESKRDTLMDLGNYAFLLVAFMDADRPADISEAYRRALHELNRGF